MATIEELKEKIEVLQRIVQLQKDHIERMQQLPQQEQPQQATGHHSTIIMDFR